MNLYEIEILESQIERIAEMNEGEIPEDLMQKLVEAQTQVPAQLENLVKYIRNLELGIDTCKAEEARIKAMRDKADNRIKSIKKYLTPYVIKKGKVDTGTFKLSTRKSESVELTDEFKLKHEENKYYNIVKTIYHADKRLIKEDLKAGKDIPGARLSENRSIQIK